MNQKKYAFLSNVLKNRFAPEVPAWKSALRQNFDIALVCPSFEIQRVLINFLNAELSDMTPIPRVVPYSSLSEVPESSEILAAEAKNDRNGRPSVMGTIYVCEGQPPKGIGLVVFEIQKMQALLPSPAQMVTTLLEMTGLEGFMDSFDGKKMTQLRTLLDKNGFDDFFDAIIQVAYLVGFRADDKGAEDYLEKQLMKPYRADQRSSQVSAQNQIISLEKLFEHLIELPEPHDTLKAALAYYVFVRRRVSQTEASRILKVSRSTLQSHLQLAERLKVAHYFNIPTSQV